MTLVLLLTQVQNQLTGQLPEFAALSTLEYIDVSHNNLNGSISTSWLDNPSLAYFSASYNQLTVGPAAITYVSRHTIPFLLLHGAFTICTNMRQILHSIPQMSAGNALTGRRLCLQGTIPPLQTNSSRLMAGWPKQCGCLMLNLPTWLHALSF